MLEHHRKHQIAERGNLLTLVQGRNTLYSFGSGSSLYPVKVLDLVGPTIPFCILY